MLRKENRVTKKKDIERIFKKGKGFKEDFLILKTVKNNLNNSRFCFIVSKKISKKAVIRNKVKRILREAIKLNLKLSGFQSLAGGEKEDLFFLSSSTDNLFIALTGIEKKEFKQINEVVEKLLKKAKI